MPTRRTPTTPPPVKCWAVLLSDGRYWMNDEGLPWLLRRWHAERVAGNTEGSRPVRGTFTEDPPSKGKSSRAAQAKRAKPAKAPKPKGRVRSGSSDSSGNRKA